MLLLDVLALSTAPVRSPVFCRSVPVVRPALCVMGLPPGIAQDCLICNHQAVDRVAFETLACNCVAVWACAARFLPAGGAAGGSSPAAPVDWPGLRANPRCAAECPQLCILRQPAFIIKVKVRAVKRRNGS